MNHEEFEKQNIFGIGQENTAFAQYFIGRSYLNPLTAGSALFFANVTFEPGCRNNWHVHRADKGGGQILLCIAGEGWYQEWGKPARSLKAGDVVVIPAGSSTGTARRRGAGSPISRRKSPAKTRGTSGRKRCLTRSTTRSESKGR